MVGRGFAKRVGSAVLAGAVASVLLIASAPVAAADIEFPPPTDPPVVTTAAPTTAAPVTQAPTTQAPTTAAPETTAPPVTSAAPAPAPAPTGGGGARRAPATTARPRVTAPTDATEPPAPEPAPEPPPSEVTTVPSTPPSSRASAPVAPSRVTTTTRAASPAPSGETVVEPVSSTNKMISMLLIGMLAVIAAVIGFGSRRRNAPANDQQFQVSAVDAAAAPVETARIGRRATAREHDAAGVPSETEDGGLVTGAPAAPAILTRTAQQLAAEDEPDISALVAQAREKLRTRT